MRANNSFSPNEIQTYRYWIQGYPNFYEPIAEEYFRFAGYRIVRRPAQVSKTDIQRLIGRLFDGVQPTGPAMNRKKLITQLEKRSRMQPDLLLERNGQYYLGELKSWGGFRSGRFDVATLRSEFFKDPIRGAFFLLDRIEACGPIAGKVLVVSSRCEEPEQVSALLQETYHHPIELFYLDEIMQTPQLAGLIDRQLRYLDTAVAELKQALRTRREENGL